MTCLRDVLDVSGILVFPRKCSDQTDTLIFSAASAANSEFNSPPPQSAAVAAKRMPTGSEVETQIYQIFAKMDSEISDFQRSGCRRGHRLFIDQLKEKRVVHLLSV